MKDPPGKKSAQGALFAPAAAVRPQEYWVAHIDGGARGNPGPAGYGAVITDQAGRRVAELSEYLGHRTNNYAEYAGLLAVLEQARRAGARGLKVFSDSELLVRQIEGRYKVRSPELKLLHAEAQRLRRELAWFAIEHVRREKNRAADKLANRAMDRGKPHHGGTETRSHREIG